MLKAVTPILLIALAACTTDAVPTQSAAAVGENEQRALQGRVVGEPVSCITSRDILDTDAITDRVVLFHMRGGRTYRSDLPQSCPRLSRPGTAFTHRTTINRLCNVDIIDVFDPTTGMSYGSCTLGKFMPYELPEGVSRNSQ